MATLTKRHFIDAAKRIRFSYDLADLMERAEASKAAELLADMFREANPRFNRETFLRACGLER